jgi:sRNA-binding protein
MSSIIEKRRSINRSINWPAYREQRAHLADIFAVIAYSGQAKRPLALGIKYDLIGANTGFGAADIKHFLRAYTFGPKYLRTLKPGAWRIGLDGHVDGWVSPNEAEYARLALEAHYADRERRRLVRDIGARAVAVAVQQPAPVVFDEWKHEPWPYATPDEPNYPYRFAREAA